jgi:hypothetical protein
MTTTPRKGHEVLVTDMRTCDLCGNGTAADYDARLPRYGSWANVCEDHFRAEHCSTGVGHGQRYIVVDPS